MSLLTWGNICFRVCLRKRLAGGGEGTHFVSYISKNLWCNKCILAIIHRKHSHRNLSSCSGSNRLRNLFSDPCCRGNTNHRSNRNIRIYPKRLAINLFTLRNQIASEMPPARFRIGVVYHLDRQVYIPRLPPRVF